MNRIVFIISLVIWIIYLLLVLNREIYRKNKNREKYNFSFLRKNIFYIIRLDTLFFLIIFIIYKNFDNSSVTSYLYFVLVSSSLVFISYELKDKYHIKENKVKNELVYYLFFLILILIPIIHYIITKNIERTELITLIISFATPVVIYLVKMYRVKFVNKKGDENERE